MSKRQKIPAGSVWDLYSSDGSFVLHAGVSAQEAPHLLRGDTDIPLVAVPVGGSTGVEFEGEGRRLRFELVRKDQILPVDPLCPTGECLVECNPEAHGI